MFFNVVNPMDNQDGLGETLCDLSQARMAPYRNTWRHFSEYSILLQFEARSTKRTAIFIKQDQTQLYLYDTLLAEFIEKVTCMKTKDQLYQRWKRDSETMRVVLKTNSQSGSQDLLVQEAKASWESQQDAESYGETRSNTADYRVLRCIDLNGETAGCTATKITSQSWSRCSRNISIRNNFLKDMSQKQEINRFSKELQNRSTTWPTQRSSNSARIVKNFNVLIAMLFFFSEIGIICCSCGRKLKYKRSPTTTQKAYCDFTSILGFVIEKNSSRGPKHGASERQVMFYRAREMLKKARKPKHGGHPTILARWFSQEGYRKSLRSTFLAKSKFCFSIASLLKDTTIQLHKLSGYRTPNIGFSVWMLMGPKPLQHLA